jgi:D-beta-D-heptose 7-phosphate kinase/D-beta-D-heptose 1-phosphate adenosyltransferase
METIKKIWVNGCFDILHRGHIELLQYAKSFGDKLIVGIDYDDRVKIAKGPTRPFNTFSDRKFVLEALSCVDLVIGFASDEELEKIIEKESPSVMVIGSDWKGKEVIGQQYAKKLIYFSRIPNYSTTKILERK